MTILPIIDLLILIGWTLLSVGALLKAIYVTTNYRPTLLGLGPMECAIGATVFLLLVLALAARTWVKAAESGRLMACRPVQDGPAHFASPGGSEQGEASAPQERSSISPAGERG